MNFFKHSKRKKTPNPIHLWDDDKRFNHLMLVIKGYTLVDRVRCYMLYQFASSVLSLPGDVAEVGVYKGGTARLLAKTMMPSEKGLHLFDTFGGMPSVDMGKDRHREGDFGDTSIESVKDYLKDCNNVFLYKGVFPHTSMTLAEKNFCFVHVDVDIYKSVIDCCDFFYQRLVKGGVMFFDDYGFITCPGAKEAVDEFFSAKHERPCYLTTGQCLIIKQ